MFNGYEHNERNESKQKIKQNECIYIQTKCMVTQWLSEYIIWYTKIKENLTARFHFYFFILAMNA